MDNESRGLLFFILGFTCIWLVFDKFYGKNYIGNLATLLTPNVPSAGSVASSIVSHVTSSAKKAYTTTMNKAGKAATKSLDNAPKPPPIIGG